MNEFNPKIIRTDKIASVDPNSNQKISHQKGDDTFSDILTKQMGGENAEPISSPSSFLSEIESSYKANQLNLTLSQSEATQSLASSLNMLETYAAWLGDPEKTLKQTYSLLEEVLAQTETLEEQFKGQAKVSTELQQLLDQVRTTAQIEQVKLIRGDYSD